MSHDIYLIPPKGTELVVPEEELIAHYGDLPQRGWGSPSFEGYFNVTYNYGAIYRLFNWGITDLKDKRANNQRNMKKMREIVAKCGVHPYKNYREWDGWAPTPGNAGFRLKTMLIWAEANPLARWEF